MKCIARLRSKPWSAAWVLLSLLSFLLCSCQLDLGGYIRAEEVPCTLYVVKEPRDQPVYQLNEHVYAMELHEWQATIHPSFYQCGVFTPQYDCITYIQKTGKSQWLVRSRRGSNDGWRTDYLMKTPDLLGTKLRLLSDVDTSISTRYCYANPADVGVHAPSPSLGKKILAIPFDFVIDPVGTYAGTGIYLGGILIKSVILAPTYIAQQQQNLTINEVKADRPPVPESWRKPYHDSLYWKEYREAPWCKSSNSL